MPHFVAGAAVGALAWEKITDLFDSVFGSDSTAGTLAKWAVIGAGVYVAAKATKVI